MSGFMISPLLLVAAAAWLATGRAHSYIRTENDKVDSRVALEVSSQGSLVRSSETGKAGAAQQSCGTIGKGGDFVLAVTAGSIVGYMPDVDANGLQTTKEFVIVSNFKTFASSITKISAARSPCPNAWALDGNGYPWWGQPTSASNPTGNWTFTPYTTGTSYSSLDAGPDFVFFYKSGCTTNLTTYCLYFTAVDGSWKSPATVLPMWSPWNGTAGTVASAFSPVQIPATVSAGESSIWVVDTYGNIYSCTRPCYAMCVVRGPGGTAMDPTCSSNGYGNIPSNPWNIAFVTNASISAAPTSREITWGLTSTNFDVADGGSIGIWKYVPATASSCTGASQLALCVAVAGQVWNRSPSALSDGADKMVCNGPAASAASAAPCVPAQGTSNLPGSGAPVSVSATASHLWLLASNSAPNSLYRCLGPCKTNAWVQVPSETIPGAWDR